MHHYSDKFLWGDNMQVVFCPSFICAWNQMSCRDIRTVVLHRDFWMVCSPDGETDFFDYITGILRRDTLALYLFIICHEYILRVSIDLIKEISFTFKKARSRQYPTETDRWRLRRRSSASQKYTRKLVVWVFMAYQPL